MEHQKRILIITPRSPFTNTGACEQDRLSGIEWFVSQGFAVEVITKAFPSDTESIEMYTQKLGIAITPVAYAYRNRSGISKVITLFRRLIWPPYWDGASYEYFDPETRRVVAEKILSFKPDYVWFDYTYLWPLFDLFTKKNIPIITRSINFEPTHFLDEDGRTIINYIRSIPKYVSEYRTLIGSDYLFSITPKEEKLYRRLGNTPVETLPLRSLPAIVENTRVLPIHDGIHIGFMPSTYNVHHNKEALRFLVHDIIPSLPDDIRSQITLHVTGGKFPKEMEHVMPKEVMYEGFVPHVVAFWSGMDIAIAPSLFGAGMQQKVFEPIALGIPTITSRHGLATYPFECGKEVICAETKDEVVRAITHLISHKSSLFEIGAAGKEKSKQLFSRNVFSKKLEKVFTIITNAQ